jgi:hypothetical protein
LYENEKEKIPFRIYHERKAGLTSMYGGEGETEGSNGKTPVDT